MVQSVQSSYSKDVGWRTFIVDWIPGLIFTVLITFPIAIVTIIAVYIVLTHKFPLSDYFLTKSFLYDSILLPIILFAWGFLDVRKMYRMTRNNAFASIDNEKLVLNFGRDSFLWAHVQSVKLEGERKLTVVYTDRGKRKQKLNDLKWLSGKEGFIQNVKKICIENNILYSESDMTFPSRIGLSLRIVR